MRQHQPAPSCDRAGVGLIEAGEDAQQRRLSAPVRAENADPRARLDVQIRAAQDAAPTEGLGDPAGGELRHGRHLASVAARRVGGNRATHTERHQMAPAIHLGPETPEHLVKAIEDGGGTLAPLEEAEAVVWVGQPDELPDLPEGVQWVQLQSAGIEPWVERVRATSGVTFTSATGAYASQVAEHALALLLAGVRGINRYARAWSWDPGADDTLEGSTVAVIGAGGIGRELIKLLEPHDVNILAVTRSGRDGTLPVERIGEIWSQADHFVVCAPSTEDTKHLIGAPELWVMKPHTWIVNIARGSLIDTDALVQALAGRIIGGAALDVTDPEPLPDGHPLWASPHALITPHVANPASAMARDLAKRVEENVRRYAAGEDLLAPVDVGAGY